MHGATHEVTNVVAPLADYNVFTTDTALQEAVARAGAAGHVADLAAYGERRDPLRSARVRPAPPETPATHCRCTTT